MPKINLNKRKLAVPFALALLILSACANVTTVSAQPTVVYISPQELTVYICDVFTLDLNIEDVVNLYAWEVNITFNPDLMALIKVEEGPFLSTGGTTMMVMNNGTGWVHIGCALLVGGFPVSGSGTLAYLTFHCKGEGEASVGFSFGSLLDPDMNEIPHETLPGFVTQLEYPLKYTKWCIPDFGQHSSCWCWVAAAANCFYWYKHYGNYTDLYPNKWETVDPDSRNATSDHKDNDGDGSVDEDPYDGIDNDGDGWIDEDGNDWYDDMDNWAPGPVYKPGYQPNPGYWTLLRKIAEATWHDINMNGIKDVNEPNYIYSQGVWKWDYLLGLQNFLRKQCHASRLKIHDILDPDWFIAGSMVPAGGPGGRDWEPDPGQRSPNPTNAYILEAQGINIEFRTPTFQDYIRELGRCQDVLLWMRHIADPLDDHVVTGVSFDTATKTIGFADPWTHGPVPPHDDADPGQNLPDHNKNASHTPDPYDYATVISEDPFKIERPDGSVWRIIDMVFISPCHPKYELFGPRADKLMIKLYPDFIAEAAAFEACEIDMMDYPLRHEFASAWAENPDINLTYFGVNLDEMVLEFNHNATVSGEPNPCTVLSFRQAIAHTVDRNYLTGTIMEGTGIPIYTEVPPYPCLTEYQHPEIRPGGLLGDLTYPFNITRTEELLTSDGFLIGPEGWRYWDRNGNGIMDPGEELNLKFCIPIEDPYKIAISEYLINIIESPPIQIQVSRYYISNYDAFLMVMLDKDFHLYLADRNLRADPDFLYDMRHSSMYWHPSVCPNYVHFCNETYDFWAEQLRNAHTEEEAIAAAHKCQEIFASQAGAVPICVRTGFKAHKRCYSGPEEPYYCHNWKGIINGYWDKCSCGAEVGVNSWWSFLNMHPKGFEMGDCEHMTIRYGLMTPMLKWLNPLYAYEYWDWEVLNKIYDTLIKNDPYCPKRDIPWIAKNWTVGWWINPQTGENHTKLTFTLRTDVFWQDGVQLTPEDIKFTLEELPELLEENGYPMPWFYSKIKDVHNVAILDPCTVIVYMDTCSRWSLHWIGKLKILPKHVWKPIIMNGTPTAFQPDPELIGCGPWRFSEYVASSHVLLEKNVGFFQWCPIHVNIHTSAPPNYEYRQKLPPYSSVNFTVALHNLWWNCCYGGELIVGKRIVLESGGGETVLIEEHSKPLRSCQPDIEVLGPFNFSKCHRKIKVQVHIEGPEVLIDPETGEPKPNPWLCQWINVTYDFWSTIKEDIVGGTYIDPHGYAHTQMDIPDCQVDIMDVARAARVFGSHLCHPNWDAICDINGDFRVDILDVAGIAKMFGWDC